MVSPGSITVFAVLLKSKEHTFEADLSQQIGDGNILLTIERPKNIATNKQYRVVLSFKYAPDEAVTKLELRQVLSFYDEIKIHQV